MRKRTTRRPLLIAGFLAGSALPAWFAGAALWNLLFDPAATPGRGLFFLPAALFLLMLSAGGLWLVREALSVYEWDEHGVTRRTPGRRPDRIGWADVAEYEDLGELSRRLIAADGGRITVRAGLADAGEELLAEIDRRVAPLRDKCLGALLERGRNVWTYGWRRVPIHRIRWNGDLLEQSGLNGRAALRLSELRVAEVSGHYVNGFRAGDVVRLKSSDSRRDVVILPQMRNRDLLVELVLRLAPEARWVDWQKEPGSDPEEIRLRLERTRRSLRSTLRIQLPVVLLLGGLLAGLTALPGNDGRPKVPRNRSLAPAALVLAGMGSLIFLQRRILHRHARRLTEQLGEMGETRGSGSRS